MKGSFILEGAARLLLPWLVALSLVTFYRGHHLPGGGFIGGLLAASGFALIALGAGEGAARRALRVDPVGLMTCGLTVALVAALAGLFRGGGLLAGLWLPVWSLPLIGDVHLGTPMLFDFGVYLTVAGFALQVIFSLLEDAA
ncbi:MAG: Na(+)/H(+) antiporter subunit B [Verrucomicrobia bacterium]|nr:MAG: Na(+)/H(+) antiporter subunit B [Verrucomicrobiota bacterium]